MTVEEAAAPVKVPTRIHRSIAASAHRGAKFLDKRRPDWFKRVDIEVLDMTAACNCIYGQLQVEHLLSEFAEDSHQRYRGSPAYKNGNSVEEQFGYLAPDAAAMWARRKDRALGWERSSSDHLDAVWNALQEEWLREIMHRRHEERAAA